MIEMIEPKEPGELAYEAFVASNLMKCNCAVDPWTDLSDMDRTAWADAEEAVKNAQRPNVEQAVRVLIDACHGAALEAGWWRDPETGQDVREWPEKHFKLWVGSKLALVHSEVSEGLEGHRKNLQDDKLPHFKMLDVELADAVIRICDLAGGLGSQMAPATAQKLAYNAIRPDHKAEARAAAGGKSF